MPKVHLILQGKGGVGKSFISAVLAQFLISKGHSPLCIDTDPINSTFVGYKSLNVHKLEIMEDDEINTRKFDYLIEMIAASKQDVIIDSGASSFVPLSHYLLSNQIPELLSQLGYQLVLHTVITGGQAQLDTVSGFMDMAEHFSDEASIVVWLNPYWGSIEVEGREFEQMKAYKDNEKRVTAIIRIPELKEETFGEDLSEILKKRITFDEALAKADMPIVVRQRLKIIKSQLFQQMEAAAIL